MINVFQIAVHSIPHILTEHGGIAIFFLLALGIFGLPIPDETLLVVAGMLSAKSKINFFMVIISASLGSIVGITISYLIGLFIGKQILLKYGRYIGITENKLAKAHAWFEKIGKWFLVIGYYIPGVRHVTGILAGASYLSFWEFALFAYTGAILWCSTFIIIGYFFYVQWQHFW